MAKRKSISKKIRFEVFKRDSFKCQYCGRSAPEIILHVDHIKPVKENGDNDILNYITACQDCNLGKGARKLNDSSEIEKQKKELDLLQERREQLEMLVQWRIGLQSVKNMEVESINDALETVVNGTLTERAKPEIARLIDQYSFKEVLNAVYLSDKYDINKGGIIKYLRIICRYEREKSEKPYLFKLLYVRGILKNRIPYYEFERNDIIGILEELFKNGSPIELLTSKAKISDSLNEFIKNTSGVN